jgi:hypothetical protein
MAVISTGLAITYQTGFFAEIIDFNWTGMSRESVDTSNFASTGGRTFVPGTLYDGGEVQVEMIFDPETSPLVPLAAAAETVTVTFSDPAPASTMAADMFMTGFEIAGPLEDRMTATATLKVAGTVTHG